MKGSAMKDRSRDGRRGERGFALVLAILSLMLLTFLGLTMATTTSTELQIATNFRWSQQALYNAEAGLEAGRVVLSEVSSVSSEWAGILPPARTGLKWLPRPDGDPPPVGGTSTGRDYEMTSCDDRGGVGYGLVLVGKDATRYENASSYEGGDRLNGAFTLWVRRPLLADDSGQYSDEERNDTLIIVSEGVAPYSADGVSGRVSALLRSRQAVRILETRLTLGLTTAGDPCGLGTGRGQEGGSAMGENFNPCVNITPGAGGTLGGVFGGDGAGTLGSLGPVE
jgi:hypothetical protein